MKNMFDDDRDFDFSDDMLNPMTDCRHFARRRDVNTFNMTNYMSCENCRHFTADYRCSLGMDAKLTGRV